MQCRRCGKCCMRPVLKLCEVGLGDDKELEKWLTNYHCDVFKDSKYMYLRLPFVCSKLEHNQRTGTYSCKDYENRPKICRNYSCFDERMMAQVLSKIKEGKCTTSIGKE